MPSEPGTLSLGEDGIVHLRVDDERYFLEPREVKALLQYGRIVPINASLSRVAGSTDGKTSLSIEGHATVNRSGKAVIFYTRVGHYIIPLVSFQRVVRGEAVSAPLFPLLADVQGGQS